MAIQNFRYNTTIKTLLGNEWKVDLRPADSAAPSPRDMYLAHDGFTLSYKGEGEEFTNPLRSSEVSILMTVTNQDDEDFINSIATDQDQKAVIELFKKEGALYPSYWLGYVWIDTLKMSYGGFPYTVKIAASDSIARFKKYTGFTYNSGTVWGYFQQVFGNYSPLGAIGQSGNVSLSATSMGGNQKIRWASRYWTSGLAAYENFWYKLSTSFSGNATDINTLHNRLDTVSDWLKIWNFRVFLEDGFYKILEFRHQSEGTVNWIDHDTDGVPVSGTTVEVLDVNSGNLNKILDGGIYFFKRPARGSELTYYDTAPSISSPPATTTDSLDFQVDGADSINNDLLENNFGEIWTRILQYNNGVDPASDVTNRVSIDEGVTLHDINYYFQENQDWLYSLPQKYFNGTIRSANYKFSNTLILADERYICNAATLTASSDEWQGEWVKVADLDETPLLSQNADAEIDTQTGLTNLKTQ